MDNDTVCYVRETPRDGEKRERRRRISEMAERNQVPCTCSLVFPSSPSGSLLLPRYLLLVFPDVIFFPDVFSFFPDMFFSPGIGRFSRRMKLGFPPGRGIVFGLDLYQRVIDQTWHVRRKHTMKIELAGTRR
ncbi:hypothetical protein M758_11G013400 [Ceratodon purpureus]|nr:hypothetical protein M758_11G013400 [Ceratodon purpureus]